ncbi:MAG: SGNH/GDSL hydrolase family protein [Tyzzerella sp.]|nr:SGNH/GDSL hydrolase family protein [Tyzzerella sp.]
MKIAEKLAAKAKDNFEQPGVTIAFLGDSITQGCFELYRIDEERFETVFDKNSAYHFYLAKILSVLYPTVPVTMINAGVSGGNAEHGLKRLERDVLRHRPDLTVVCFGLNDCGHYADGLKTYCDSLEQIFANLEEAGSEIIFMTPNMMATYVSFRLKDEKFRLIAEKSAERQNEGVLDMYLNEAKKICERRGIKVCDCYEKWKVLSNNGVDVTELLANQINHPLREMNWLFAVSLVETMLS